MLRRVAWHSPPGRTDETHQSPASLDPLLFQHCQSGWHLSSQSLPSREMAVCRMWTEEQSLMRQHAIRRLWIAQTESGPRELAGPWLEISLSGRLRHETDAGPVASPSRNKARCLGPWPSPPSMTSGRSHGEVSGLGTPSCFHQRFLAWQRTGRSDVPASFFDPPIFHRSSALSCPPVRRPVLGPDDGLDGHVFFVVAGTE